MSEAIMNSRHSITEARPDISAIVVNYNAGALLRNCIDSLLACPLKVQVILVDNASVDNSLATLAAMPDVQILRNTSNRGFAAACNQGIAVARADNLLFLNPDCTFIPGTLNHLLESLHCEAKVGMVGGLLLNSDGTEQAGGRRAVPTPWRSFVRAFGLSRFARRWPKLFYDFHLHTQPLPSEPVEVEAISGACMMVKRAALEEIGLWDEHYFLHCEDLDWCMRLRAAGWKVMFVPTARITHALGICSRNRPFFVEWHKHHGMIRFYRKFFRHQYPSLLMQLVCIGVWVRFLLVCAVKSTQLLLSRLGVGKRA